MNSPLGKYGQIVAAIVAVGTIGAYVLVIVVGALAGIDTEGPTAALRDFALFSIGAVFGSFAAVNGVKAPIDAAHSRIDKLEVGTAIPTHGAQLPLPGNDRPQVTDCMREAGHDGPCNGWPLPGHPGYQAAVDRAGRSSR